MKQLLLLLLAACIAPPALAQRPFGWYVGPTSAVTSVNGEAGILTGLEGGLVIHERFTNRFVTSGQSRVLDQEDMRGFAGSVGLRFGHF